MRVFLSMLKLRCLLLLRSKAFWGVYVIIILSVGYMLINLYSQVDKGILIPIAIVDNDQTQLSRYIVQAVQSSSLLAVHGVTEDEGFDMLENQTAESLFIIVQGAEEKIDAGDRQGIMDVYSLEGNYFSAMLSDIVAGEFLDEIAIRIASSYYYQAMEKEENVLLDEQIYNALYLHGQTLKQRQRTNYYLDIAFEGEGERRELSWYNQQLLLEKITTGIMYIFVAFFMLYAGMSILHDRESFIYFRFRMTGMKIFDMMLSEYCTMLISGLLAILPLSIISILYGSKVMHTLGVNVLYIIGTSSMLYLFLHLVHGTLYYLLTGSTLILTMGILSGSFFSIDTLGKQATYVARIFPVFYSIKAYFDEPFIKELLNYTVIYSVLTLGICYFLAKYGMILKHYRGVEK